MATRSPRQALRQLQLIVDNSPHVEQDITQWSAVDLREIEPGQWRMVVTDLQGIEYDPIYFSYYELSINDLYAAQEAANTKGKPNEFIPVITIDSPRGSTPGATSGLSVEQLRAKVEAQVKAQGLPGEPAKPTPTLWQGVKKLVRMIKLRMRL